MLDSQQTLARHETLLRDIKAKISAEFPIVNDGGKSLEAKNFRWDKFGADMMLDLAAQKDAKLKEKSVTSTLKADLTLYDAEGTVLDQKSGYTVMMMPHVTARNSYIIEGNELQVVQQLRLRPGLYTENKGEREVETYLNTTAAGQYKVLLDRKTGIIRFKIGSDKKVPIYTLMHCLGANDMEIRGLLGDLYEDNKKAHKGEADITKLLTSLSGYLKPGTEEENKNTIKEFLASKPLDPEVNKLTTGKPLDKIDLQAVKEATRKCIEVSRGEGEEDDMESLAFKSLHAVDDFVKDRLDKGIPTIRRYVAYQMRTKGNVAAVMPSTAFGKLVTDFMTTSEFIRYSDQNNPIDINAINTVATVMGEGGISNPKAVKNSVREIHPSHFGVIDSLHTQEGNSVGVVSHLTVGAKKVGNRIHLQVFNAKTGKPEEFSVEELMPYTVAFADQYENLRAMKGKPKVKAKFKKVKVRRGSKLLEVDPKEVDYIFNDPVSFFSTSSNAVPFMNSNTANRVLMADKHIEQSVQLADPDAPLVQHKPEALGAGFQEFFGDGMLAKSPVDGTVGRVTNDFIMVKGKDGKEYKVNIYNNYPLNSKTFLNDTPLVKRGHKVKAGQSLVESNFTKNKVLALGKNLNVAMVPYKGYNFEDGTVITEAAAKKLASVHKNEYRVEKDSNVRIGLDDFLANFPQNIENMKEGFRDNYDKNGIIKKGTIVNKDDVLIPAVREVNMRKTDLVSLHKKILSNSYSDISSYWNKDVSGEIIDVINDRGFVKVIVKSVEPAVVGDKLSAFAGAKGIITKILGPDEVYKDSEGNEVDLLFNPFASTGRINPGFLLEAGAGKVARKTGKTFYTENFNMKHESNLAHVQDALKKAGIDDEDVITNEHTGHSIPRVLVGPIHTLKLKHVIDGKFSARGATGNPYTTLEQPQKVSGESAQKIGRLDGFTLLSGGGTAFLDDAFRIKGQRNDEYWTALQLGETLPPPRTPFVAEKFVASLLAAGINLEKDGDEIKASPMTDKEILRISHGEIDSPSTLKAPALTPMKKGLFDPDITGGIGGNKFSHIELAEPIINPLMTEAVISVGGFVSGVELENVMLHKKGVDSSGNVVDEGGTTGVEGVIKKLDQVDIDSEIKNLSTRIPKLKNTALNKANRRLRYLKALKKMDMRPSEAYINRHVAVIPPKFRQITEMPDGKMSIADSNHSYQELILLNRQLKDLKTLGVDNENLAPIRAGLFQATSATAGLSPHVTKGREYRGLIEEINGVKETKYGLFQGKLQSRQQDLSGRSTVIPNPKLGLDDVGIPKKMAMTIYEPFVVKEMVISGYTPMAAKKAAKEFDPHAVSALKKVISDRPVLMTRAPSLHKFNMMSFKPTLTDGKAIEVNPLIVNGYNMDFDGNCVDFNAQVYYKIPVLNQEQSAVYSVLNKLGEDNQSRSPYCTQTLMNNDLSKNMFDSLENSAMLVATGSIKNLATDIEDMKFTKETKIKAILPDGIIVETAIGGTPHNREAGELRADGSTMYPVPEGMQVLSYDHINKTSSWETVTHFIEDGTHDVFKVTTISGHSVTASSNDSLCVYDSGSGGIKKVRPEGSEGMLVPVVAKIPQFDGLGTFDCGWLLGAFVGDGSIHNKQLKLANVSDEIRKKFEDVITSQEFAEFATTLCPELSSAGPFLVKYTNTYREQGTGDSRKLADSISVGFSLSSAASLFFHRFYDNSREVQDIQNGVIKRSAIYKSFPFNYHLSEEALYGVLSGILDTDSTINVGRTMRRGKELVRYNIASSTSSSSLRDALVDLGNLLGVRASVTVVKPKEGRLQKHDNYIISWGKSDIKRISSGIVLTHKERAATLRDMCASDLSCYSPKDVLPVSEALLAAIIKCQPQNKASLSTIKNRTKPHVYLTRETAVKALDTMDRDRLDSTFSDQLKIWEALVADTTITWSPITKVEDHGREEVYDIMVPATKIFSCNDGMIVYDTAGIHVPVSEEARKEALTKLMPSRNLVSPRADFVVHTPSKETLLGIYLLTKPKGDPIKVKSMAEARVMLRTKKIREDTAIQIGNDIHCVGQDIVNEVFPDNLKPGLITLTSRVLDQLFLDVAKELKPDNAARIISKLKDLGNHYVTELGYAVSLRDLEFDTKARDKIIQKLERDAPTIGFAEASEEARQALTALLQAATDNRFVEGTFSSGATGKGGAVQQMIATPIAVTDSKGEVIPFAIRKSYAEGHDLGSYLGTTPGARQGLIDKGLSVANTGYLARILVNSNIRNQISEDDCGTQQGATLNVTDNEVLGRYGVKGSLRNVVITKEVLNRYKKNTKAKTIEVRSALHCKSLGGICSKCAGLDSEGRPYNKGFHIGSLAAQSIGERATQTTLQSFHHAGAVGSTGVGFERIEQLFTLPQVAKNKAVLAEESGRVENINKMPAGGFEVIINGHKHFIPQELKTKVAVGQQVKAGDQLSLYGNVNPRELLDATGDIKRVQNTLISELQKAYTGQKIKRRVFETVVKPMTDSAVVTDAGGAGQLFNVFNGEKHQVNVLEDYNSKLKARGLPLIKYQPILLGIKQVPHQDQDFIGRLTHERLKDTLKAAPALNQGTHLTKGHPISQLVLKNFRSVEDIKNPRTKLR